MRKISLILFMLFLLESISSIQTYLEDTAQNPNKIKIGRPIEYYKNNNYFTFEYNFASDNVSIFFYFDDAGFDKDLYLIYPNGRKAPLTKEPNGYYQETLNQNGTYGLELICESYFYEIGGTLNTLIVGGIMDTINLDENIYFSDFCLGSNQYYGEIKYLVTDLQKNKSVYFTFEYYNPGEYKPYYPDLEDPVNNNNIEVVDITNNVPSSNKDVKAFLFEKGKKYYIIIHSYKSKHYSYYSYYNNYNYYYDKYKFFPVNDDNFKIIDGSETMLSSNGPMIGVIKPQINKLFYITNDYINKIYYYKTSSEIQLKIEDLKKLDESKFSKDNIIKIQRNESEYTIFIAYSKDYVSKVILNFIDETDDDCKDSYTIESNQAKLITCYDNEEHLKYYNYITTFSSTQKNLKLTFSENETLTDFIIQNYIGPPVIATKSSQKYTVNIKKYHPKFALFGAADSYIFDIFYQYGKYYIKQNNGVNIDNYKRLNQAYIRVNSKYLPWFEFYNGYFNQMDIKLNFYIKQLYGGSELYECDKEKDQKDLTFLTTPISNLKCKNKRSVFNRLFNFRDTKVLSGYISPESYFDIYAEVEKDDNNNNTIEIYSYTYEKLKIQNNAKYLRQGVTYRLNFYVNHLIKLEPGFATEITITNGQTSSKLTPEMPITEILGSGYTIQSTNDSMVYFISKISEQMIMQREINYDRSKGKVIKLSNVDSDILIDIGFEGYLPSTVPYELTKRKSGIYYVDNIYEKYKGKLVEGEKVYIYHVEGDNRDMRIEYIDKNINYKNNDFNIFLIQPNYDNITNDLIIDTYQRTTIIADLLFCDEDTILYMSLDGEDEKYAMFTYDNFTLLNKMRFDLFRGDNKVSFLTSHPVVFTYSYYDYIDENYFSNNEEYEEDRKKNYILTITQVTDKNNNYDIINIKFKPNYRNSSTRYILIVAQENSQNTLDNFKSPCYIANLINQRPKDVKIDVIYDVGENADIEAEVNIEDILHEKNKDNKYLINIISQELRFDKQMYIYQPFQFNHTRRKPDDKSDEEEKPSDSGDQPTSNPEGDSEKDDKGGISDSTSLALAITLPIVSAIIIIAVVFIVFRHKRMQSENIEKLTE